jgi:predicted deacylase
VTRETVTASLIASLRGSAGPRRVHSAIPSSGGHSGGSSLDILPSTVLEPTDDPELHKRNVAAVRAFDAPLVVVVSNYGDARTATAAACKAGLTTVGTEMGGGGTVRPEVLDICRRGVRNVLAHFGVLETGSAPPIPRSEAPLFQLPGSSAFVYATDDGIFEPFHPNGRSVRAGEPAGRIHYTWNPAREPDTLHYQTDGILYGRRQPGRVRAGNCCLVVAAPYDGEID